MGGVEGFLNKKISGYGLECIEYSLNTVIFSEHALIVDKIFPNRGSHH